jgi:hypothetical protein
VGTIEGICRNTYLSIYILDLCGDFLLEKGEGALEALNRDTENMDFRVSE